MGGFIEVVNIISSLIIFVFELVLVFHLIKKIVRIHKLSLKDTAIYPIIILITMVILLIAKFQFMDRFTADGKEITNLDIIASSLKGAVSIAALSLDTDIVKTLFAANELSSSLLLIVYVFAYVISGLALMSISISLIVVGCANFFRLRYYCIFRRKSQEVDYILGFNDDCKEYLKNYYENNIRKILDLKKLKKENFILRLKVIFGFCLETTKLRKTINNNCKKIEIIKKNYKKNVRQKLYVVLDNSFLDKHEEERFFLFKYRIPFINKPYLKKNDLQKTINKLLSKKKKNIKLILFFDDDKLIFDFVQIALDYFKEYDLNEINKYMKNGKINSEIPLYLFAQYCNKRAKMETDDTIIIDDNTKIIVDKINNKYSIVKDGLILDPITKFNKVYKTIFNKEKYSENDLLKHEIIIMSSIEQDRFLNNCLFTNKIDRIENNDKVQILKDDFEIKDESYGRIRIINKYDLIANEFVKNHNLAKYIPTTVLNKDLTIKDADMNY